VIETDGPYGGYSCSNSSHIHHHGEGDSVYMQVRGQGDFYKELRNKGFFINAPDDYFFQVSSLSMRPGILPYHCRSTMQACSCQVLTLHSAFCLQGTNKEGVGYNENQFSLPRLEQLVITRATLYEVGQAYLHLLRHRLDVRRALSWHLP
jgi:hypothetical protein